MKRAPVGIGIIGTGFARTTQIPGFRDCMGAKVVAVASRNRDRAEAIATTFAPMQSRKPGICVVRANPVPMIPIPTGDLFMALLFKPQITRIANHESRPARRAIMVTSWLAPMGLAMCIW